MVSYLRKSTCKKTTKTKKTRKGVVGRAVNTAEELWDRALSGGSKQTKCPKTDKAGGKKKKKTKGGRKSPGTKASTRKGTRTRTKTRTRTGTKAATCRGKKCKRGDEADMPQSPKFSPATNISAISISVDDPEKLRDLDHNGSEKFQGIFGLVKRAANALEKRQPQGVRMDQAAGRRWEMYDTMSTAGISHCSVLVIYTDVEIAMAHIPQARISRDGRVTFGGEVMAEHLRTLRHSIDMFNYTPRAIFYYNRSLVTYGTEEYDQVINWLIDNGISRRNIVAVQHDGGRRGSGRLTITHMGNRRAAHHVLD